LLIAGRAIQGAGAGGVNVLVEIIICDLVPLRERGNYIALIFGFITVGTALGPVFGGLIVDKASWRWIFYLNLPVGGTALVLLLLFLPVKYETETTILAKLRHIDWTGNVIFASSVVAILMPLSWAGTQYAWSSFRIIVPLVLGLLGFVAFLFYEGSRFCLEPTMPIHLFTNRTSATSFILTFFHSIITVWTIYFLQVYFQGVLASTPGRAGIQMLPTIMFLIPFTAIAGRIMSKWGLYRPIHHIGFALMAIGFGLFSLFDANTSTAEWVIYQGLEAAGAGLVIPALLPAVQVELTEADIALSTSTWAFFRSFGMIWGASIPAVIFSNTFDRLSGRITDLAVADTLTGAKAYEHATKIFLDSLQDPTVRAQVVGVFSHSLKTTWYVAIAFAGLGFIIVIAEREVPLREELETEFGMTDK
jgi:Major Facilitator Superfamily